MRGRIGKAFKGTARIPFLKTIHALAAQSRYTLVPCEKHSLADILKSRVACHRFPQQWPTFAGHRRQGAWCGYRKIAERKLELRITQIEIHAIIAGGSNQIERVGAALGECVSKTLEAWNDYLER
jgi:hypothetical protein